MEKKLEPYLHTHIPISQAMGIRVQLASKEKIILTAPFLNNINHKKTVFGGSLHAVATLAAWSLLYVNLKEEGIENKQIVITKSDVQYLAPVDDDFTVECTLPEHGIWQRFIKTLRVKGKARIHLSSTLHMRDKLCVDYKGVFAAISDQKI